MKKLLITLIMIFNSLLIFSQTKFKAEYEKRSFMKMNNESAELTNLLEQNFSKPIFLDLLVNENICLSKEVEKINNKQGSVNNVKIIGGYRELERLNNFNTNKSLVLNELGSKFYEVSDSIQLIKWNLTREEKQLMGYKVKKATYSDGFIDIIVWYTPLIKTKCGPDEFNGLPGLAIEIEKKFVEDSNQYVKYNLIKISENNNNNNIKLSKKAKKLSLHEFKILEKKINNNTKIIINQGVNKD